MESLMRNFFQSLGKNKAVNRLARRYGLRFGAHRFVAGETLPEAIDTIAQLNADGILGTLDHVGEFVTTPLEAKASADMCLDALDQIAETRVTSHISVKLTQLGLDIDRRMCKEHMEQILQRAKSHGNFVRIDMEDSAHCQTTIDMFKELWQPFSNVGLVIQAYLYRSESDVQDLNTIHANLRLVKGAYKEPPSVAFPLKKDVDANFIKLIRMHVDNGNYTAVATHDEKVISLVKSYVREHSISKEQFEFQMLYGIRTDLQKSLVKEGYHVRVYVPFGCDWFGYYMRRLAERPANVAFVMKSMFRR